MQPIRLKGTFAIIILLFCVGLICNAQPNVSFTADKTGGCSPLSVSFTNTTTGASSSAIYKWVFSNGNTSSLKNAGAVFLDEHSYTVTLTVTDSGKTAAQSKTITVYKNPSVDFSASLQKGCIPLPLNYTANATANDGTIAEYFWDFGDGVTQSTSNNIVNHTYVAAQKPTVSVTVTNSFGCQAVMEKKIVEVLPELVASFSADKNVLCTISDQAKFINTSNGPGNLSYQWDFGDGVNSTSTNPSHVFSTIGTYDIKLAVTSSDGCITNSVQNTAINVANFKSEIAVTGPVCRDAGTGFISKSKPFPDQSYWEFGDGPGGYTSYPGDSTAGHNYTAIGQYTVKLTNDFGGCKDVVTKTIVVNESPVLKGFLADITSPCGSPVKVNFKDTTSGAVKWEWTSGWPNTLASTEQSPSHIFTFDYYHDIYLKVSNAAGCTANGYKQVNTYGPSVKISSPDVAMNGQVLSCGPRPLHFVATSAVAITSYKWDFDDGNFSTDVLPVHSYNKAGYYRVRLAYTTINGCTDTVEYENPVIVRDKVKADFTFSSTDICGNTPVTVTNNSGNNGLNGYLFWDFGDGNQVASDAGQYYSFIHQFQEEGVFTIKLIVTDLVCADTMIKTNYIKVSPPFPKINGYKNTCDGTRGEVTFEQSSKQVVTGSWDFGDGTPPVTYTEVPEVKHTYTKTGWYKVVLSTTNGSCTVKDSVYITVLLKQHPILSANKTEVCSLNSDVELTYSNLEKNPKGYTIGRGYDPYGWYHTDGSFAPGAIGSNGSSGVGGGENRGDTAFTIFIRNFIVGKEGIRSLVVSHYFGCTDTTNALPLKILGPSIGFKINNPPCTNGNVVYFEDTSKSSNGVALSSWEWFFGDGPWQTFNHGGETIHSYYYAQAYQVGLRVTDATGCASEFFTSIDVSSNSLKASFTASATVISPGTTINFTNTSKTSDQNNTTYKWMLGDGTVLTTLDAIKTFTIPGTYTVNLIATNQAAGCTDTASVTIFVKFVNAAFAISPTFISGSKCPPVLVSLANTSSNVSKISWDFGDGTQVDNLFNPTHVYTKPGLYKIRVTTVSDNGTQYTTVDSILINGVSAKLTADLLHSCTAQSVTLSATSKNVATYLWDFGDGAIVKATDTFAVHLYSNAGTYTPQLIVTDSLGCSSSVTLSDKIVIDSLSLSLGAVPQSVCTPKTIMFEPLIVNIAADQGQQTLIYHWDFGTGNKADTSNKKSPSFVYNQPGNYPVSLKVQSPFGCVKTVQTTIVALQGLGALINGPAEVCQQTSVQFTGATQLAGQPLWKWIFNDGSTVQQQNPPLKIYNDSGNFQIKLIVDNDGCVDTITKSILVHGKPVVGLSARQALVCEGSKVVITASGGTGYAWLPVAGLGSVNNATVNAGPIANTTYTVKVTSAFGCTNIDSVKIEVVHPFKMQVSPDAAICNGQHITLQATGAATYLWIGNTTGLNNTLIGNPVAASAATATFTVVGTDANKCFSDTANVKIVVNPIPTVDAGQSVVILSGTAHQLQPITSGDVIKWEWSPAKYLSCVDCAQPVAKPTESVIYQVAVNNAQGCTATDTVSINLMCSESRVYIPSAFSPNNDGINDEFSIKGQGIRLVNHLIIYNRYGQVIFERSNFQIDDKAAAWDGRLKGSPVPAGAYVYFAEMSCNEKTFTRKGSVTVVY